MSIIAMAEDKPDREEEKKIEIHRQSRTPIRRIADRTETHQLRRVQ